MFASIPAVNRAIVACERCPRLRAYCHRVAREKKREFRDWDYWGKPVPGFGDPDARLLIVGLAPAAHGANRTGRMFTGDSSGHWLYEALYRYGFASQPEAVSRDDGLTLSDCYISAAARCAPPGNKPSRAELGAEVWPAAVELRAARLVAGRGTTRGGADVAVAGREAIGARRRFRLAREAGALQRLVQPVATRVAREHPACAVGAVCGGREPDDEQPRVRIPEPGHRLPPIGPIAELTLLIARHALAVGAQAGATVAGDDGAVDGSERGKHGAKCRWGIACRAETDTL